MALPPVSNLDERQILQSAFDEGERRLRTDAILSTGDISITVDLDPEDDGVYIGDKDSGNKLKINDDGSINVDVLSDISGLNKNIFNEQLAVASGSTVNLVTYTVPAGKTANLQRIFTSGENIAKYEIFLNGIKIDCGRTYFGSALNLSLQYESNDSVFSLVSADILVVTVLHNRPSTADFQGRIQLTEIG